MFMRQKTWLATHGFAFFLILSLATALTLSLWQVPWYPMHDSTHPVRLMLLRETVLGGQFPAIWASHINLGYGYPLFHLYAPLFHYLALAFTSFFSLALSLKLTLWLTLAVGGTGVWVATRSLGRSASTLAVVCFLFSPFLALDLYVRGAYAELLSLALFPWVLTTLQNLKTAKTVIPASLATSLFLLSHNLIPILALPLVLALLANVRPSLKTLLAYSLLTFGLTAWYLFPLVFERGFTHAEDIAKTTAYAKHFVEPWQIWNSTWGFGGSALGVEDGMSFKLGKLQLLLATLGVLTAVVKRNSSTLLLALFLLFSLALATPVSAPLWENLSLLQVVQFPWRSLGLAAVLLSLLAGYSLTLIKSRHLRASLALLLSLAAIFLNYKYFRVQTSLEFPTAVTDIAPVVPEYLPVWMTAPPTTPSQNGQVAYYPTWVVNENQQRLPTSPDAAGLLTYQPSSNTAPVTLTQGHTPLQKLGYTTTILTLLYLAGYCWRRRT